MGINSLNAKLANGGGDRGLLDIQIALCVSITSGVFCFAKTLDFLGEIYKHFSARNNLRYQFVKQCDDTMHNLHCPHVLFVLEKQKMHK